MFGQVSKSQILLSNRVVKGFGERAAQPHSIFLGIPSPGGKEGGSDYCSICNANVALTIRLSGYSLTYLLSSPPPPSPPPSCVQRLLFR